VKKDVKSELMSWLWGADMAPGEGVESALASSCHFWPCFLLQTRFLWRYPSQALGMAGSQLQVETWWWHGHCLLRMVLPSCGITSFVGGGASVLSGSLLYISLPWDCDWTSLCGSSCPMGRKQWLLLGCQSSLGSLADKWAASMCVLLWAEACSWHPCKMWRGCRRCWSWQRHCAGQGVGRSFCGRV